MRFLFVSLTIAAILSAAPSMAQGAEPPLEEPGNAAVAAPLRGMELVEAKALSTTGNVLVPRRDSRVPKLLIDLLGQEDIARIYPWCQFALQDGHPIWTWHTWNNSGIFETDPESLRARLVEQLQKQNFKPLPGTPNTIPRIRRSGELPFKYRRLEDHREVTIEMGDFGPWTGGRRPAVGIKIVCTIRGLQKIETPALSEVIAAVPTIALPSHGKVPIPPSMVELLHPLPVTSVQLSGPGTTWYSLTIATPQASLDEFRLQERLEGQLMKDGFVKDESPNNPQDRAEWLLNYVKRLARETAHGRIRLETRGNDYRIHLFVQTN